VTATIHVGDALNVLRTLPDASIDAVITDPPYCAGAVSEAGRAAAKGQGLRSENIKRFGWFVGDNMGTAGLAFLLRDVAFECVRVVKQSGSLLMFCDWRMFAMLQPAIESAGVRFQNLVVWDKGHAGLGAGFRAQHELVLHFTFGAPEYHDRGTGNVLQVGRVASEDREHQTQKPVDLLRRLVRVAAPEDGVVLDPFCGSGSTGVACALERRNFVGIERDAEHAETARRRIENTEEPLRQGGLFAARTAAGGGA
jgi:DNA modification methylase